MEYTHLGRSGLKVSRLCLGTMNFGPQTGESEAHAIMDSARESGINFFDTANVYGGSDHRGWTEEIIGRWFAKGGERRERTVLATKLYGTMTDDLQPADTEHRIGSRPGGPAVRDRDHSLVPAARRASGRSA
jgi:aryl-alcohol dehydrogenase-like predicted oxidoreductase